VTLGYETRSHQTLPSGVKHPKKTPRDYLNDLTEKLRPWITQQTPFANLPNTKGSYLRSTTASASVPSIATHVSLSRG